MGGEGCVAGGGTEVRGEGLAAEMLRWWRRRCGRVAAMGEAWLRRWEGEAVMGDVGDWRRGGRQWWLCWKAEVGGGSGRWKSRGGGRRRCEGEEEDDAMCRRGRGQAPPPLSKQSWRLPERKEKPTTAEGKKESEKLERRSTVGSSKRTLALNKTNDKSESKLVH